MSLQDLTPEQLNKLADAKSKSEFRRLSIMMDQDPIETEKVFENNTQEASEDTKHPAIVSGTIRTTKSMNKAGTRPLNVRSGPGYEHPIVRVIEDDTVYEIVEEVNGFGRIDNTEEWVCLEFLKEI